MNTYILEYIQKGGNKTIQTGLVFDTYVWPQNDLLGEILCLCMIEYEHEIKIWCIMKKDIHREKRLMYPKSITWNRKTLYLILSSEPSFWQPDRASLLWSRLTQGAPGCSLEYLTYSWTWFFSKNFCCSIICVIFQFFEQGGSQIPSPCWDHVNKSRQRHTERTSLPVVVCLDS